MGKPAEEGESPVSERRNDMAESRVHRDTRNLDGYLLLSNGGAFQTEERSGYALETMSNPEVGVKMAISNQWGFPRGLVVKYPPANAGDAGDVVLIPGSGRSPRGGSGNPF